MVPKFNKFKDRNKLTFRITKDGFGNYHWKLISRNGKVLCQSPEDGYHKLINCLTAIGIVMEHASKAMIEHYYEKQKPGPKTGFNYRKQEELYD